VCRGSKRDMVSEKNEVANKVRGEFSWVLVASRSPVSSVRSLAYSAGPVSCQ